MNPVDIFPYTHMRNTRVIEDGCRLRYGRTLCGRWRSGTNGGAFGAFRASFFVRLFGACGVVPPSSTLCVVHIARVGFPFGRLRKLSQGRCVCVCVCVC